MDTVMIILKFYWRGIRSCKVDNFEFHFCTGDAIVGLYFIYVGCVVIPLLGFNCIMQHPVRQRLNPAPNKSSNISLAISISTSMHLWSTTSTPFLPWTSKNCQNLEAHVSFQIQLREKSLLVSAQKFYPVCKT